jgi:N-acetylmuramic acid 6-phosphate etherase
MKPKLRERITERTNPAAASLDTQPTQEILRIINREDHRVAPAVRRILPQVSRAVDLAVAAIRNGGRLVYLGAGTSGRLGVLDASECAPTFGSSSIAAVLAGAPAALWRSVEGLEDNPELGAGDLKKIHFHKSDVLVGISASGRAPYVMGAMRFARRRRARTIALTCNPEAPMAALADIVICPVVGPEVIAGSSRMKAGTAQKLVLNMLSTATMVRMGRVLSNRMINVQLTNQKLWNRAEGILMNLTGAGKAEAGKALKDSRRNLPVALLMVLKKIPRSKAASQLQEGPSVAAVLRQAIKEVSQRRKWVSESVSQ